MLTDYESFTKKDIQDKIVNLIVMMAMQKKTNPIAIIFSSVPLPHCPGAMRGGESACGTSVSHFSRHVGVAY